ncbi:MAG: hypothetical protein ACRES5_10225 [Pseudomonas sp.]
MALTVLAESCNNGPCPTLYLNPGKDVIVQAVTITDPDDLPEGMPSHESALRIPQKDWQRLLADLPLRHIAIAVRGRLARQWRRLVDA